MISLSTFFWLMVGFFALMGALRGWTREVIATSGLVLSLFALNQFGSFLINLLGITGETITNAAGETIPLARRQFYILAVIHLTIAFFSYQGPTIAGSRLAERLRVRDNIQDKLLGVLIGGVNGYLIIGSLWAFLEYQVIAAGEWQRLAAGINYPFDPAIITRPEVDTAAVTLMNNLPLPMLAPYLPILVVVVFLFVIIVMI